MNPLRVAVFTDNDFSKVNGVTTTLRALLAHAPGDIRPRIFTCERRPADRPDYFAAGAVGVGIPFYREMQMYLPPVRRLLREAMETRVDLIHFTTPGPVGLAALYVASKLRVPMVGSFHTDLAEYTRLLSGSRWLGDLMQQYMRWPYGKCRQVLVPSAATREALLRSGMAPSRVGLWRRGVACDHFSPARRSPALRGAWGASEARPVLLYVGRVSKEKGLDLLPALTERLQRSGLRHRLVVVGDGPMRAELSDRCTGAIFTGTLTPDEVAVAMASADAFVFPSRTDTAGNVVLEAQASGLPVLVTDAGGPAEQMLDGVTGHVCPDVRAFTARLCVLLGSLARRAEMGGHARRHAERRPWPVALEPLYRAYREVAASQGADAPIGVGPVVASESAA